MLPSWQELISSEKKQSYFAAMMQHIDTQRQSGQLIYPPPAEIFNAFTLTPLDNTKVVILGQDPYHGPGQAHGLSFSVPDGIKIPPSLRNIYKELDRDIESFHVPSHGNLEAWAKQGVLLLNTVLTVEQGKAHSHAKLGWEQFTDRVIHTLNETRQGIVFLLWGSHAQKKGRFIDTSLHHVLTSVHPSPLSAHRGFIGCGHFSKTNELLIQQGHKPINWQV